MGDLLGAFAVLAAVAVIMVLWWRVQDVWLERTRPASDISRLKAAMEDSARRVIRVEPDGVIAGSRSSPAWRNYRVFVRELDGEVTEHSIGVEATLLGYPSVRDYSHPKRTRRI